MNDSIAIMNKSFYIYAVKNRNSNKEDAINLVL